MHNTATKQISHVFEFAIDIHRLCLVPLSIRAAYGLYFKQCKYEGNMQFVVSHG